MKICILGAGTWGLSFTSMLCKNGHDIAVWTCFEDEAQTLSTTRQTPLLPGLTLSKNVTVSTDLSQCLKNSEYVFLVVPSFAIRRTVERLPEVIKEDQPIIILSKGFEESTLSRLSCVVSSVLPNNSVAVMSGPSHAEEVYRGLPTTNVVASNDADLSKKIQDTFNTDAFRLYTCDDLIGVECGGALKNVIALCAGISDGLGYGDNTKAALMTRGIAEISRLGIAMGAKKETFLGLSGIGDLIVTCTSMHSRNRRAGILLGQGASLEDAKKQIGMVIEGANTVTAAVRLSEKYNVEMPICQEAYNVLFKGKSAKIAVYDLMTRQTKSEEK